MKLSVIIPAYQSENTILPLLSSLDGSSGVRFSDVEVIIVDDKSPDKTNFNITQYYQSKRKITNIKIIRLKKNTGPAHARNIGAKYAKGDIILFLDADVTVYKDTIEKIIYSFRTDPDLFALTGVWDKTQRSRNFFPRFKALRDWSYWIFERDPKNYYYLFSTRIAAIRRDLFLRLHGFDETYKAALIEDIELTYRIARRYAVVFNPEVVVHHEFEDFLPVARKYFWRSYFWSKIYRTRKKFDPVATTGKEALSTVTGAGSLVLGVATAISMAVVFLFAWDITFLKTAWWVMGNLFLVCLLIHLYTVRKFIWFCMKEEGIWFALRSFFTGMILYLVILSGAVYSFMR